MTRACSQLSQPDVGTHEIEQGNEVIDKFFITCSNAAKLFEAIATRRIEWHYLSSLLTGISLTFVERMARTLKMQQARETPA